MKNGHVERVRKTILSMPLTEVRAGDTTTICFHTQESVKPFRLVCAESYPTLYLTSVMVGNRLQGSPPMEVALSTFHREKDLDEVLERLRAGQTFSGHNGAANAALVEAVEALTKNFPLQTLQVGMVLAMTVRNRGSSPVLFSCYWEGVASV